VECPAEFLWNKWPLSGGTGGRIQWNTHERLNKWLSWAKEHADRLDPLQKGLPFELDVPVFD
jgi:hypothetical protein